MARRILYNPADFAQASTPFYDNLIGTITDQADRIERNILMQRENEMFQTQMRHDVGMLDRRLDAQREMQDDQMEFRRDESELDREATQSRHEDTMALGWAQVFGQQTQEFNRQMEQSMREHQEAIKDQASRVNDMHDTLRKSGLIASDAPERFEVTHDGENFRVWNPNTMNSAPVEQWIAEHTPLINFSEAVMGGQNWGQWSRSNLYNAREDYSGSDTYTGTTLDGQQVEVNVTGDTFVDGDGRVYYGRDGFASMIDQVRNRTYGYETALQTLNDIMDGDSNVNLLMKDDDRGPRFDQIQINSEFNEIRTALENEATYRHYLIDEDGRFVPRDGDVNGLLPNLREFQFTNQPNKQFEAKTIGGAMHAAIDFQHEYPNAPVQPLQYIQRVRKTAVDTISEYFDEIVPEQLRERSPDWLANIVRINEDEYMSRSPNLKNMFIWPSDPTKLEELATTEGDPTGLPAAERRRENHRYMERHGYATPENLILPWERGYDPNRIGF